MSAFNKVILMGNLTRDPEMRYTSSGKTIANFGLAINRNYLSKDGEKKEEVDFFDISAWDKTAELCNQYLEKGSGVLIEGRLKQERWEDDGGNKRSKIVVVASAVQFLSRGQKGDNSGPGDTSAPGRKSNEPPF